MSRLFSLKFPNFKIPTFKIHTLTIIITCLTLTSFCLKSSTAAAFHHSYPKTAETSVKAHGFLLELFNEGYFTDLDLSSDVEYIRQVHIAYSVFLGALAKYHQYRSIDEEEDEFNSDFSFHPEHLVQTWFRNIGFNSDQFSEEFFDFEENDLSYDRDFYDEEYSFYGPRLSGHCETRGVSEECLEQPFIDDLHKKLELGKVC